MANISRLKAGEISDGNTIFADDLEAELDQLVSAHNANDTILQALIGGAYTITGPTTFTNGPKTNTIDERSTGSGVTIDGMLAKNGYVNIAAIRATISGVDTSTDVFTTSAVHGLTTADPVKIRAAQGATLSTGISEGTTYYVRVLTTTTFTLHTTAADATNNANIVNITAAGSGTRQVIATPTTLYEGDVWMDPEGVKIRHGGSSKRVWTASDTFPFPTGYRGGAAPVYSTASQFTVATIACRDSTDAVNISKTSSTTVDMTTTGLNGIASSTITGNGNFCFGVVAGTHSVNTSTDVFTTTNPHGLTTGDMIAWDSAGTLPTSSPQIVTGTNYFVNVPTTTTFTVHTTRVAALAGTGKIDVSTTGSGGWRSVTALLGDGTTFTSSLVAGDVVKIGTGAWRIGSVTSDTIAPLSSTGGNGTGAYGAITRGAELDSTFYYLYAITDGTTPGLLLSTRNVAGGSTLVDLPSGYTYYRQLPFAVRNDSSSNLIPFSVGNGWPVRPFIAYQNGVSYATAATTISAGANNIVAAGTGGTAVSAASYVPPISREARLHLIANNLANGTWTFNANGDSTILKTFNTNGTAINSDDIDLRLSSAQAFDYARQYNAPTIYIDVIGFLVSEVV